MTAELDHVWQQIQGALRESVGERTYGLWIEPLRCVALDRERLLLDGPPEVSSWASRRLGDALASAAAVGSWRRTSPSRSPAAAMSPPPPRRASLRAESPLNPKYTFEQFVIGPSNRLAHAAALSVAEMPSQAYNPLFIYGPPGLGKTHLLHSVGNYVNAFGGGLAVRYATAEEFTNAFLAALAARSLEDFKAHFRDVDVLLIDDVQFFERKARSEEELFHTFNALYAAGSQLVISCDRLPGDLGGLEDRLRERFAAGLVTDIERPDFATRLAIVRKRAAHDGVAIAPDALELLAARVTTNVRALEGALIRLVAYGSLDLATARQRRRRARARTPRRRTEHRPRTLDRGDPGCRLRPLRPDARGVAVALARRARRLAAPGRDVSLQGVDRALAADDRPRLRRPRPHDRPLRLQARRCAHHHLAERLRRHRGAHGESRPTAMTRSLHRLSTGARARPVPVACEHWRSYSQAHTPYDYKHVPMKLSLSTATFLEELQTAARVASTRSAVQALSGVQLHADAGGVELRATDMEVGLRLPLAATVQTPGDVVLPARLLLDVIRSLPGPEVSIELRSAEQDVEITSGECDLPPADAAQRGLPAPAERRRRGRHNTGRRAVHRHRRARLALGLAR